MEVIFTWMDGPKLDKFRTSCGSTLQSSIDSAACASVGQTKGVSCACESSQTGKRKRVKLSSSTADSDLSFPIDEILLWHKAINQELGEIAEAARRMQLNDEFTDLSAFNERLHFVTEVCIFHRYCYALLCLPYIFRLTYFLRFEVFLFFGTKSNLLFGSHTT